MALSYSMDKIGPMCRVAEDCDLVLKVISGHDPEDAGSLPEASARYEGAVRGSALPRLGWLANQWKEKDIAPEVSAAGTAARKVLDPSLPMPVKDVSLPDGPWETAAGVIISVEGAAAFRSLVRAGQVAELSDPLGRIGAYMNEEVSAADFIAAQRIRGILQRKMDEIFDGVDVLVSTSLPVTASKLDANLDLALSFADPIGGIGNVCGLPAISVPCGFGKDGLPIGLQFIGRVLDDAKVVQAAQLYQSRTNWHKQRPKL
jgi:aspartyl-tRNA(Asn)/glutamyl-tRNA(Gln) amidotransferase subunit A